MTAATGTQREERCSWCGVPVEPGDGYRAAEPAGERRAAFCRLEHVIPWGMQGAHWDPGGPATSSPAGDSEPAACSECGQPLTDVRVDLVRHRGEHRILDAFCSVDHMVAWAKGGGRWR